MSEVDRGHSSDADRRISRLETRVRILGFALVLSVVAVMVLLYDAWARGRAFATHSLFTREFNVPSPSEWSTVSVHGGLAPAIDGRSIGFFLAGGPFADARHQTRIELDGGGGQRIVFIDQKGQTRLRLAATVDGTPSITLFGADGKTTWSAPAVEGMVESWPPNPRLQRTRSASPPSPLSRQPLGRGTSTCAAVAVLALVCSSLAPADQGNSASPSVPFYDWGACPFECCTYREWTANAPTTLMKETRPDSPIAFELAAGESVMGLTGVVVTSRPGRLLARRTFTLGEKPHRTASVQRGDAVYVIHYTSEGFSLFWFKGRLYSDQLDVESVDDPKFPSNTDFRVMSTPKVTWWVKVRNAEGQTGWTFQSENFDHMDACE